MLRVLVTGGTGLMGKTLHELLLDPNIFDRQSMFNFVGSKQLDITQYGQVKKVVEHERPDIILHLAAYTDVAMAEVEKRKCYAANVLGTRYLAKFAKHLIYMSTEYVFDGERGNYHEDDIPNPVNFYSLTKLLGEHEASKAKKFTIIRTLFKPRPFKHQTVATDMWTSGDYVDVIAAELVKALSISEHLPRVLHIGTGKKNLFDLAKQTRKDVLAIKRLSLPIRLPRDTSLNTKVWEELKKKHSL